MINESISFPPFFVLLIAWSLIEIGTAGLPTYLRQGPSTPFANEFAPRIVKSPTLTLFDELHLLFLKMLLLQFLHGQLA